MRDGDDVNRIFPSEGECGRMVHLYGRVSVPVLFWMALSFKMQSEKNREGCCLLPVTRNLLLHCAILVPLLLLFWVVVGKIRI